MIGSKEDEERRGRDSKKALGRGVEEGGRERKEGDGVGDREGRRRDGECD